jgi:hypothetical protein
MPYRSGLKAIQNLQGKSKGVVRVAIYLPTKTSHIHLPRRMAGFSISYCSEAKLELVISLGSICPVKPPFD